jgi:hypothetical protein
VRPLHSLNYAANVQFAEVRKVGYHFNGGKDEEYLWETTLTDYHHYQIPIIKSNTLIIANANTIDTTNAKDNEKSQKVNWWDKWIRFTWNQAKGIKQRSRAWKSDWWHKAKVHLWL